MLSCATSVRASKETFKYLTLAGIDGNAVSNGQFEISQEDIDAGNVVSHKFKFELLANDIETI